MTDLATRIEQATGPDRELDAEIWTLIIDLSDPDINEPVFRHIVSRILAGGNDGECPAYTASIDAAMLLKPESCSVSVQQRRPWEYYWFGLRCQDQHETFEGRHINPALALCAAALRARDAKP